MTIVEALIERKLLYKWRILHCHVWLPAGFSSLALVALLWLMKQIFHTGLGIDKQSTSYEFTRVALAKSNLPKRGYCVSYLYYCIFPCLLDMFTKRWFGCVPNVWYWHPQVTHKYDNWWYRYGPNCRSILHTHPPKKRWSDSILGYFGIFWGWSSTNKWLISIIVGFIWYIIIYIYYIYIYCIIYIIIW